MANLRNSALNCSLDSTGSKLVIEIGINTLLHALMMGPGWPEDFVITQKDQKEFVKSFLRGLESEEEDGTTPIHRMLDAVALECLEQGEEGFTEAEDEGQRLEKELSRLRAEMNEEPVTSFITLNDSALFEQDTKQFYGVGDHMAAAFAEVNKEFECESLPYTDEQVAAMNADLEEESKIDIQTIPFMDLYSAVVTIECAHEAEEIAKAHGILAAYAITAEQAFQEVERRRALYETLDDEARLAMKHAGIL